MPDFFLFEYEFYHLEFSESFGFAKLTSIKIIINLLLLRNMNRNRIKMIFGFFLLIKIFIPNVILNPWKFRKNLDKNEIFKQYIFLKFALKSF